MYSKVFFFIFALFCLNACGQVLEDKQIIDPFTATTSLLIVTTPASGDFDPQIATASTQSNSIIGGERDIQLTALSGNSLVFSTSVNNGVWDISTPQRGSGFSFLQYDGVDGDIEVDEEGLNSLNLISDFGSAFRIVYLVDEDTDITLVVYGNGNVCDRVIPVDGIPGNNLQESIISFASFTGNCDFSDIGAIEIYVAGFVNVDFALTTFVTYGEVAPTPSRTPSRSASPTTPETASNTPTPSAAPSQEVNACECDCPAFHCGLVYAVPGDDDDTVDDDIHDDDDIIYRPVYYGPVDDDFINILGDDDEFELISREGGLTVNHNDDDDETGNSSSVLAVSITLLVLVAVSLF